MFKQYMILGVLFFLVVNNQASSIQISQPSISEMIKALGDSSFEVREKAAKDLDFMQAAKLRDEIKALQDKL